jgi:hypothetical protein
MGATAAVFLFKTAKPQQPLNERSRIRTACGIA